ncbi:MAG: PqqD family protein [Polyangia bacterium]|jgi:hypothetical protein|nr:PqqD family protein [Polyangia bacterium]
MTDQADRTKPGEAKDQAGAVSAGSPRASDETSAPSPTPASPLRPRALPGLLSREIDDELVLVDPRSGEAYLLNPMGSSVLDLCDGRSTIAEIILEISSTLGAPEEEVAAEVRKFVADLAGRGLLVEGDPE